MDYELITLAAQLRDLADKLYALGEERRAVLTEAYVTEVLDKLITEGCR